MKQCKECPWKVKTRHNETIVNFSKKTSQVHNCHMKEGKKNLWKAEPGLECTGALNFHKNDK